MEIYQPKLEKIKKTFLVSLGGIALTTALYYPSEALTTNPKMHSKQSSEQIESLSDKEIIHNNVTATMFWVGENADKDNGYISNHSSAWADNWVNMFGGVDDPRHRNGNFPATFVPKENPFYFALPFSDYGVNGNPKKDLSMVPWYIGPLKNGQSILKNQWIKIKSGNGIAYAQWEDVGPFNSNDWEYVFGHHKPRYYKSGLDVSPSVDKYLNMQGEAKVSWQFVEYKDVPPGPWREIVTTSPPSW